MLVEVEELLVNNKTSSALKFIVNIDRFSSNKNPFEGHFKKTPIIMSKRLVPTLGLAAAAYAIPEVERQS